MHHRRKIKHAAITATNTEDQINIIDNAATAAKLAEAKKIIVLIQFELRVSFFKCLAIAQNLS